MRLHHNVLLRRLGLNLLARLNPGDVTIRHHWARERKLRLHSYKHRGYWFHGRGRERAVMEGFARLVRPGDSVIELGGHIGYASLYLASLAGPRGRVVVFEPSPDNRAYLEANVAGMPWIEVIPAAASHQAGRADFYVEDLTGQNATLVPEYHNFTENRAKAFSDACYRRIQVDTMTLDEFVEARELAVDFVKIDVEGAELEALQGMERLLAKQRPQLMVEVTRNNADVFALLGKAGYQAYEADFRKTDGHEPSTGPNLFFLHPARPVPLKAGRSDP